MKNYLKAWELPFITHRPYLVSFAFRMTGSLAESEELVQETFLDCVGVDPSTISNQKSWLTKICSNKSIDLLRSAYKKRETYVGTWLPDAVPDSYQYWGDYDQGLINSETLSTTFLLLAEKLSPEERVVYILREIFEYTFQEISDFLGKSSESLRKTAQRARDAINSQKVRYNSHTSEAQKLVSKFFEVAKLQDKTELLSLLAGESEFWADGGGQANAIRVVVKDVSQIVRFFTSDLMSGIFKSPELRIEAASANFLPGLIISKQEEDGAWVFETIMTFEMRENKILRIYSQRNPEKLKALTPQNI